MKNINVISAVIYLGSAVILAGLFVLGSSLLGDFNLVDKIGGAVWVFILSTIILMPIVIPLVKRKYNG